MKLVIKLETLVGLTPEECLVLGNVAACLGDSDGGMGRAASIGRKERAICSDFAKKLATMGEVQERVAEFRAEHNIE